LNTGTRCYCNAEEPGYTHFGRVESLRCWNERSKARTFSLWSYVICKVHPCWTNSSLRSYLNKWHPIYPSSYAPQQGRQRLYLRPPYQVTFRAFSDEVEKRPFIATKIPPNTETASVHFQLPRPPLYPNNTRRKKPLLFLSYPKPYSAPSAATDGKPRLCLRL
jgi:hypothetical protein